MEEYFELSNGVKVPRIMAGTYSINGDEAINICKSAIDAGFRGFDCGRYYKNEKDWGIAIVKSDISRDKVFIQTKVDYSQEKKGLDVKKDFETTLKNFSTNYIDSLLIHWPVFDAFLNTWSILEELYLESKIKCIGVSNFRVEHLKILKKNCRIMPMINQIERHPCRKQEELYTYCKNNNILVQAYQPLAVCNPRLMQNELLSNIANKHNCTVPQIALAWNIHTGVIPLPRTKSPERLKENFNSIFIDLSKDEIASINNDQDHYYRVMHESHEFPGYWDEIHHIDIEEIVGDIK